MATPKKLNEHTWDTFVRPSVKFKHEPDTRRLIREIMPYFPKRCECIAGYLNDADQFWKVNFHWETLVTMLNKAHTLGIRKGEVQQLLNLLLACPPTPSSGYKDSKFIGLPVDASSNEQITKRWKLMKGIKQTFRKIIDAEKLTAKYPPSTPWDIAAAPVALPGTSTHECGYAVDLFGKGWNAKIKEIATNLGATLAFDEKSHVHVEVKQGVLIDRPLVADNPYNGRYMGWMHEQVCER